MKKNVTVFMFHDIRDLADTQFKERYKMQSFLRKKDFRNIISSIIKNFTVISSDELLFPSHLKNDHKYAVVTFDDGLRDQYLCLEFLKKHGIRATFFLPSNPIRSRVVFHSHKIQFILASKDNEIVKNEILSYLDEKDRNILYKKYSKSIWKNNKWSNDMVFITNFLRNYPDQKKYDICNMLFKKYVTHDEKSLADDLYMTEKDIHNLLQEKMIIGGHGHKSLDLRTLSYEEQFHDIKQNYLFIKDLYNTDKFSFVFSYPNGGYTNNTIRILKGFNCKLAFTTREDFNMSNLEHSRFDATKYEFN